MLKCHPELRLVIPGLSRDLIIKFKTMDPRVEKIMAAAEEVGTKHALVEQDKSYDDDPFDCLKKSIDYIRALGYKD